MTSPCQIIPRKTCQIITKVTDQDPTLQTDALTSAGCYKIWTDVASGSKDDRPQLAAVIEHLRPGDTLAVWRLDRLGRSLPHLLETVARLEADGIGFTSLTEEINTTTPGGRLIFTIFAALAEFERNLLRERTFAGLEAAKKQGRTGGRPPVLDEKQKAIARKMKGAGVSMTAIADTLGVARSTLYRNVS
ncbi:recombinase family protein [Rhodococcus sp. ARC_M6]|uniref:recombinase family protein n=1 Tax=Rhodococcus sp. ARC_M6 TaxID=2928852 RepID=UPI001FB1E378|nr:recombinase family protein [Rhodococcus sp. ARC_M6]MCJ0907391.1 recombinase family protein [Rhodococcus sp. ARC_M6]